MQEHDNEAIIMIDLEWEGIFEYVESRRKDVMRAVTSSGRSEKVEEEGGGDDDAEASSICLIIFLRKVVNAMPLLLCSRLSVLDCSMATVNSLALSRESGD